MFLDEFLKGRIDMTELDQKYKTLQGMLRQADAL